MPEIGFTRNPGQRSTVAEGNVALPLVWNGGSRPTTPTLGNIVNTSGIAADAAGVKWLRGGTIVVRTGTAPWVPAANAAAISAADRVAVVSETLDVTGQSLVFVTLYITGSFHDNRLPSLAAPATPGLEAAAIAAIDTKMPGSFKWASHYAP